MSAIEVRCVRVYLTEQDKYQRLLARLHDVEKVRGVTVFRGISGFGRDGHMHSSHLIDTALDLPIVIEFFDVPQRVETIIAHLRERVPPGHIVSWAAQLET
jgi:PII-like signaling protein